MIKKIFQQLSSSWWRGAFSGILLVAIAYCFAAGLFFNSGLPLIVNILLALITAGVSICLFGLITWLLEKAFSWLPSPIIWSLGACVGTLVFLKSTAFRFSDSIFFTSSIVITLLTGAFIGVVFHLIQRGFQSLNKTLKGLAIFFFIFWFAIMGWGLSWLSGKGTNEHPLVAAKLSDEAFFDIIKAENSATLGKYKVKKLFYGSGNNKRRPEYGDKVDLKTNTVDASLLLADWKGFKKSMREWYWGFGVDKFPLNATVWYPDGQGQFPLVLIVHGNHGMEEYSDPGYEYLGTLLASRGYILASVDENFINATWSGDFMGKEMQTRAWLLLQHLNVWRTWNRTKDNLFFNKVDINNIALMGHSRGGEAVAIAAAFNKLPYYPDNAKLKFDFNFNIRALVAIAPTDRRYIRRMKLTNINYLTLQGGYDSDEPSFFGMRQADRIANNSDEYFFKAGLYIPGANHGQFNSVWGSKDAGPPSSWFLNVKPMIQEKDQQEIAKVYISGFLDATLLNKNEYVPMFESWTYARKWLPSGAFLNRFEDNRFTSIASFDDDIDITTGSASGVTINGENLEVWKEAELFYRDGKDKQANSAAILGWNNKDGKKASYTFNIPGTLPVLTQLKPTDFLTFELSVGNPGELKEKKENEKKDDQKDEVPDFSIVMTDSSNNEKSINVLKYTAVPPRWEIQYLKSKSQSAEAYGDSWEPTLGDYQIPMSAFAGIEWKSINTISFRFDKTNKGVIVLDKVGFRKGN